MQNTLAQKASKKEEAAKAAQKQPTIQLLINTNVNNFCITPKQQMEQN